MPPKRAAELLRDWAAYKPWLHYGSQAQRNACNALCMRVVMSAHEIVTKVRSGWTERRPFFRGFFRAWPLVIEP